MKIFFDTEFMEDGKTIELLSIGAVREDGSLFYLESSEADHTHANEWVKVHVLPNLYGNDVATRKDIATRFVKFCGHKPEFWAYYCSYDWVVLCQLYGMMVNLPVSWPMYCNDVKQLCNSVGNPKLPVIGASAHNALRDARWTYQAWKFCMERKVC